MGLEPDEVSELMRPPQKRFEFIDVLLVLLMDGSEQPIKNILAVYKRLRRGTSEVALKGAVAKAHRDKVATISQITTPGEQLKLRLENAEPYREQLIKKYGEDAIQAIK